MDSNFFRYLGIVVVLLSVTACTTVQPFPVPANNPPLASVRADVTAYSNQHVVWGGKILAIDVKQTFALVTVLAKPLDSDGEPIQTDQSDGRFLARLSGFRDPAVFASGRSLTVAGTLTTSETRKIGDYDYVYPVVNVTSYRLWPIPPSQSYDDHDYWWYDPWYPWYPAYPWYYPYHYHSPKKLPPSK
jgi:outer membrane lipoprotein